MAINAIGVWTLAGVEAGSIIGLFVPQVGIVAGVLGGATTGLVIGVTEKFFNQMFCEEEPVCIKTDKTSDKLITAAKVTGGLAVGLSAVHITQCGSMSDKEFCCETYFAAGSAIVLTKGLLITSLLTRKREGCET